jgi:acyl-CoA synthetase (AMP-forming)/AMP-acid ligase II
MAHWFDAPQPLLPELLALQGRWCAGRTALVCGSERRSWREFDLATNRVANALAAHGIGRGAAVAVLMRNGLEMVEAMFGILKAGAVVVPLNTSVSDDAAHAMIADSGASAVIASHEHCRRLDPLRARLPRVQAWIAVQPEAVGASWLEFAAFRDAGAAHDPEVVPDPEDPCGIIYSSGTTGLPKGIVHTHRRRLDWASDLAIALRYDSGAVTLCSLGLYSNISWVGLLCTLLAGGTVVVATGFDAGEILQLIERERITHSSMVPLQYQRLLEHPAFAASDLRSLRSLMCCGSPLQPDLKRRLIAALGCDFIELYGLTEGVITTLAPEDADRRLESVGRPLPGTDLRIVGNDDRELPAGEAGEIVSRGRIVMAGYHHRDDANAESTWVDARGRRWLRTGDIGRLDDEGFLYLVDRKKDMIISGGQNVYPADIEAVLATHPAVSEIAVVGVPSARWGESPVAVVVLRAEVTSGPAAGAGSVAGAGPAATVGSLADELRDWVNARVGKQQRVAAVHLRGSLPRNPNGKILKRELRKEYPAVP